MNKCFTSRWRFSRSRALLIAAAGAALPLALPGRAAFGDLEIDFNYTGGMQYFVMPQAGTYQIAAYGAQGGADFYGTAGGMGAYALDETTTAFAANDEIEMYVGGAGANNAKNSQGGGGGGGGTFLYDYNSSQLLVAAGGGGGSAGGVGGGQGSTGTSGGTGTGSIGASGGSGGNGGGAAASSGNAAGAGGGGYLTAGANANGSTGVAHGGGVFSGLAGGTSTDPDGVSGGYGGGGAGGIGGGGGGGYSGGGGGVFNGGGGGGGSIINGSSNYLEQSGFRAGNGMASIITQSNNLVYTVANGFADVIAGNISGSGGITLAGQGAVILQGTNTYTGGTTISAGELDIQYTGSITGNVTDNGLLTFDNLPDYTFAGNISGSGSVEKFGGITVLTGTNTYTGGTTINNGTLQLGNGGTGGIIIGNVSNGGVLEFDLSTNFNFIGNISGSGSVTQAGSGVATLLGTNTYSGGTTISAGTLQVGDGDVYGSVPGNITDNSALVFDLSSNLNYSNHISGSGSLTQAGSGLLTLNATNTYTGGSNINNGVIVAAVTNALPPTTSLTTNGGYLGLNANVTQTVGAINGNTGGVGLSPNGILVVNLTSGTDVYGGSIYDGATFGEPSDTGQLIKTGGGTLVLNGANDYGGGTTISAGILRIGNGGSAGSVAGDFTDNGRLTVFLSSTYMLAGNISGTGSFMQAGTGTTILTSNNTYTGGTTISAGSLQIQYNGLSGSITGDVADNANLTFNNTTLGATTFFNGNISGSGSVTQTGPGTTYLIGSNSYSGGTTISAGALSIGGGSTAGSITGNVNDNGKLVFNLTPGTFTFAGNISGSGSVNLPESSTIVLTGTNTYTGGTSIFGGTLQIGNGGASGSITGNITDDAALNFDVSSNLNYSGVISGSGSLTQSGSGLVILNSTNTYNGATNIANGVIVDNVTNALPPGTSLTTNGYLGLSSGVTQTVSFITGNTGGVGLSPNGIIVVNVAPGTDVYNGYFYDGAVFGQPTDTGQLIKQGGGTLVLAGDSDYGGGTTISAGILQIGNGGTSGSVVGVIKNGGLLSINRSDASVALGNNVSGTGALKLTGTGTITLTGVNTYTGTTTISAGTLVIPAASAMHANNQIIDNSALVIDGGTKASPVVLGSNGVAGITGAGALTVGVTGTAGFVQLPAGSSATVTSLTINTGSTLDIEAPGATTANNLVINYGAAADPAATIRGYLKSAYNGGIWTGAGLTSSAVAAQVAATIAAHSGGVYGIGYVDGGVDKNQAANAVVKAVGNQIVYAPALIGDASFDGSVTFIDLGIVAQNLGAINSDWEHGDFNYDGTTNFLDIGLLAQNLSFNEVNTPLDEIIPDPSAALTAQWNLAVAELEANGTQPTDLPEPGMAGLLAVGVCGLLARRRKQSNS